MKLYICSQFLFPLTPDYQGPKTKPCKVSDMMLTKFVRCLGPCPRESYGVCPRAQANIPCLGTPGQRIFYCEPQARATPFTAFLEFQRYDLLCLLPTSASKRCKDARPAKPHILTFLQEIRKMR